MNRWVERVGWSVLGMTPATVTAILLDHGWVVRNGWVVIAVAAWANIVGWNEGLSRREKGGES